MQIDLLLACLLILLGAMIGYALDEAFQLSPRLGAWLNRKGD